MEKIHMARYTIKSITKVAPPEGSSELNWYKFIIENDKNTITSLRAGSKREVNDFAIESINRLNEKYFTDVHFKIHKPVNESISVQFN